jgi:alpha-glucosidase
MLLLTLRGTPTLYYGDEIGIGEVIIPPERQCDPWGRNEAEFNVGRDPARTPMQWDDTIYAGFSSHEPWLPLTQDHATRNVGKMRGDARSILILYKNLLSLRRNHKSLRCGAWRRLQTPGETLSYERCGGDERCFVVLNLDAVPVLVPLPVDGRILLSTHGDRTHEPMKDAVNLRSDEGVIILASSASLT